jgi:transcriptional regulator with XRE-family HTH domain
MNNRSEVREFLVSRRGKVTPEQVGLATQTGAQAGARSGTRRVPGLRRGEVAELAGVSVEYYTQLERGGVRGASESVLDAIARALRLDEAERAHLFDLARAANESAPNRSASAVRRRPTVRQIPPGVQQILDGQLAPAWVRNGIGDFVAWNHLGRALNSPLFDDPARPVNSARFRFLSPRAADFYPDWDQTGRDTVAALRAEAGKNPYDKALTDLVGELSTRSEEFRTRWAAHDVRLHHTGIKRMHHPEVGELELSYQGLELASAPGLTMFVFTAELGSSSQRALDLLASWTAAQARPAPEGLGQSSSEPTARPGSG